MTNVKVHLREIIKYVLLLGVAVQGFLGLYCVICRIGLLRSPAEVLRALAGLCVGGLLAYAFLRIWCAGKSAYLYLWGWVGIITTPIVLQTCLDGGSELYRFAGLCVVLLLALGLGRYVKQRWGRICISGLALFLAGAICFVGSGAPSLAAGLMSRCGFPFLYHDVYNITPQIKEKLDFEALCEATYRTDGLYTVFYPSLLERYGSSSAADEICLELADYCLQKNTKEVMVNLLWDVAGYHFPMPVSEAQLQGMGYDALTAVNYDDFIPQIGSGGHIFWSYAVVWNALSLVLLLCIGRKTQEKGQLAFTLLFLEICVFCLVMEGAGYFDYKNLPLTEFVRMALLAECFEQIKRGLPQNEAEPAGH